MMSLRLGLPLEEAHSVGRVKEKNNKYEKMPNEACRGPVPSGILGSHVGDVKTNKRPDMNVSQRESLS